VVFAARGTLLGEELTLAAVEPMSKLEDRTLLGLTAGAYRSLAGPESSLLAASAQRHGVALDRVRSPVHHEGLGVTAVAANGQALMVGTRALALRQHVSVAAAEARINEFEVLGHNVLLTALDGRLIGITAMSDRIRPGARGAVQDLLDAGVEPTLLCSSSQTTALALAHDLGIQHVRPEILPSEQGHEVKRLQDSGSTVAVIGRGATDEPALAQAEVSIVMGGSGSGERWDVDIASSNVRDAAYAICLSKALRRNTARSILLVAAPSGLVLLLCLFGAAPWLLPLAGVGGLGLAALQDA
jgi:Cu+-exporting ATPase